MIYFDHNATAPLHPIARQAWLEAAEKFPGNPSSPHRIGSRAEAALEDARSRLAAIFGCPPGEIIWTSGATESNNQALRHFARTLPNDATVCISAIEHPSVTAASAHYFAGRVRPIPVQRDGIIDVPWLREELARQRVGLVALMAANNVTGVIQPWPEVAQLCRERGTAFLCDATQWIGRLSASELNGSGLVTGCSHKVGGPRGVGFLKCPARTKLQPLIHGGPQEDGRRAGTENVAGVLSMVAILEARQKLLGERAAPVRQQPRNHFIERLRAEMPGVEIVGGAQARLWNTVAAMMPDSDCHHRWVVKLDKFGVAVSTGSACSSGSEAPSQVLLAMGYTAAEVGRILRFSSGWETQEDDWDKLLGAITEIAVTVPGSAPPVPARQP